VTNHSQPADLQAAVAALGAAAPAVLSHERRTGHSLWRRLFEAREERHLLDDVREFGAALNSVLMSHPNFLSSADVAEIQDRVEAVTEHIEQHLETDPPAAPQSGPLVTAIYVIRSRLEEIRQAARQR
jgi:hypothetical protein